KTTSRQTAKPPRKTTKKVAKRTRAAKPMIAAEPEIEYRNFKPRTNKKNDESWDFRKANTKEFTHCFHPYPAMMIPQVARRILDNYGSKSKVLFDPYCGTGTSLVEANIKGLNAIGTD